MMQVWCTEVKKNLWVWCILTVMATLPIIASAPTINLTQGLQKAVAQSLALSVLAKNAHVNVVGPDFFQLHEVFGSIYGRASEDLDAIAERMRALGGFVAMCMTEADSMSGLPCLKAPFTAQDAVTTLVRAQDIVVSDLTGVMNAADLAGDKVTANMLQDMIMATQKSQWMLRSYLG
jgi:starvation-inducible DNA-binding protein